jgi:hypothetical protein
MYSPSLLEVFSSFSAEALNFLVGVETRGARCTGTGIIIRLHKNTFSGFNVEADQGSLFSPPPPPGLRLLINRHKQMYACGGEGKERKNGSISFVWDGIFFLPFFLARWSEKGFWLCVDCVRRKRDCTSLGSISHPSRPAPPRYAMP